MKKLLLIVFLLAIGTAYAADICYNTVTTIPANCTGTITSDTSSGTCRTIVCALGSNNIKVLACDKPDIGTKTYFEMYRQSYAGTPPKVCIDGTCIQYNGFAPSGNYPICIGTNTTNLTGATVTILENYASGQNRVFACNTTVPLQNIKWFVNGQQVFQKDSSTYNASDSRFNTYYHTFPANGTYDVSCVGTSGNTTVGGKLNVQIQTPLTTQELAALNKSIPWKVQNQFTVNGSQATIGCSLIGMGSPQAAVYFSQTNTENFELYFFTPVLSSTTYNIALPRSGQYNFSCTAGAWDNQQDPAYYNEQVPYRSAVRSSPSPSLSASFGKYVTLNPEPAGGLNITRMNSSSYNISCSPVQGTPVLSIDYGDGTYTTDNPEIGRIHTYNASGNYTVTCYQQTSACALCDRYGITLREKVFPGQNQTTPPTNTTACYNNLNSLPANCTGTITSDVKSGCRTIQCTASNGNVQVQACTKTDSGGTYFEMYKQSSSGTQPTVCIGKTCLLPNWGYQRDGYFPICMTNQTNTTQPPTNQTNTTDPGATSTLSIASGTINGQAVSTGNQITVNPGAPITGTLNLAYNDAWPQNINIPLIATPSWGDHSTSFTGFSNAYGTGKTVNINYTAPTTPGTYYIILAYRAEVTYAQVASATNWNVANPVWNDGNDIASFTSQQINDANANGRTQVSWLFNNGVQNLYVPATAIQINVGTVNQTSAQVSLVPYVSQDHNALFYCNTSFVPAEFRWDFGDGQQRVKNASTVSATTYWNYYYHTYLNNGTYTVTCTAINGTQIARGQTTVTIRTPATAAEINATVPAQDTDYFNPYVFRPVAQLINGTAYRMGGYSIGLPRNPDGSGQENDWNVPDNFYNNYIGVVDNILTFTFPQPGNYTFYSQPGINDERLTPEWYNSGIPKRGCSSQFTSCMFSSGSSTANVPDLHTRTYFGIQAVQVAPLTYNISCVNYATDQGVGGRIDLGDYNYTYYAAGHAIQHTYASPGTYQLMCYQSVVGPGYIEYEYPFTLNVTNSTPPPPSNVSTTVTIAQNYPQGNNYIFNCNAYGFTPTLFDYNFGDGQSWSNVTFNNSYHTYVNNGTYNVTCTAKNSQVSATGNLTITVGTTPPPQTCYSSVQNIPASCTGGTITSDTYNGCRTIVCTNGASNMQVLACDKTNPSRFEMYKQSQTGTAVSKICLGNTCISNNGFNSASYPYC